MVTEVGLGILLFTLIVGVLVVVILAARARRVASGDLEVIVNDERELHNDQREQQDPEPDFGEHGVAAQSWMPEKAMKPSDMSPAMMNVMPRPCRPSGTSLYLSFSRTPASAVIANAQPTPLPSP